MRKIVPLAICLLCFVLPVSAQEKAPAVEIFGGYSYLNFDFALRSAVDVGRQNGHGIGTNIAGNLTDRFGIVGDFSFHAKDVAIPAFFGAEAEIRNVYYLFGPRFSLRRERATVFAQALAGVASTRDEIGSIHKHTDVALGFGGGVDIKLNKTVALRALQIDYLPARTKNDNTDEKKWLHNVRLQFGVVFRFGGE